MVDEMAVELSQYDIAYKPRSSIKGRSLADFVVEFTDAQEVHMDTELSELLMWNLFVDGFVGQTGSGAEVILVSPKGHKLNCAIRFMFKAQIIQ